jgi:hypothetical protein
MANSILHVAASAQRMRGAEHSTLARPIPDFSVFGEMSFPSTRRECESGARRPLVKIHLALILRLLDAQTHHVFH